MTSREFQSRLSERASLGNVELDASMCARIEEFFQLLGHWNRTIRLTSLALDPPDDAALDRLVIEPLAAVVHVQGSPSNWLDLGSGGGSPAIPIKLARPAIPLTLVETKARKAAFLREAVRTLQLPSTTVLEARFESLSDDARYLRQVDLVTVRALRADAELLMTVKRFLAEGGQALLFRSEDLVDVDTSAFRVAPSVGLGNNPRSRLVSLTLA